jgi:alpha-tubulin suppressor-like RCC1 family protein
VVTSGATGSSLQLSWNAPANDGGSPITDYTIQYRKVGELSWSTFTQVSPSVATTVTVTGLTPGSTYVFRVAAVNTEGTSMWSGQEPMLNSGAVGSCAVMADGSAHCWGRNYYGQLDNNSTTDSLVPVPVTGITGLIPATTAISVGTGDELLHSCAVMADGTAKCWGLNNWGQLGDNSTTNSSVPIPVAGITGLTPATTALSVSTKDFHSCAVMADGTAKCWGRGASGQLGDGSGTNSLIPVPVWGIDGLTPATRAISVSTGNFHSCAVMADGTAKCWGSNIQGELGFNSTYTPVPLPVSDIDGLTPASTVVTLSTGYYHSCAVMADGTAKCWGDGVTGKLGNGTTTSSPVPVSVSGITGLTLAATAVSVSVGHSHSCALMADGTAKCWGLNIYGRLGNDFTYQSAVPVTVSGITALTASTTAVSVTAGFQHTCAVMADGTAKCWGNNGNGQLGDGTSDDSPVPVPVSGITGLSAAARVAPGAWGRTLAIAPGAPIGVSASGATGSSLQVSWTVPSSDGGAVITDYTIEYRHTSANSWTTFNHVASDSTSITVTGLTPGASYVFQVAAVNLVDTGMFSSPSSAASTLANAPGMPTGVSVSGATGSSLQVSWTAPANDGDSAIRDYAIQYRKVGELSWSTFAEVSPSIATTVTVTGLMPGATYVFRVAAVNTVGSSVWSGQEPTIDAGTYHSCAVIANGTAKCWGSNNYGQLGNNSTTDSPVPVQVLGITGLSPGTTALSVNAGGSHSCAVMADGTAKCWGRNYYGRLGNNSTTNSPVPVPVSGITGLTPATTALSVSTGVDHSCAVMADGTAQCWGRGDYGQLGNGLTTNRLVPVPVSGITGLTPATTALSLTTGSLHSCAVMADGTSKCWGYNSFGQLGNGSKTYSPVPGPVLVSGITGLSPGTTALSVSAGGSHSCAVMADGTAKCWGNNNNGQVGNNSTTESLAPVPVSGITGSAPPSTAVSVSTGQLYSCAVMADGTARCWGDNTYGPLGNNSTDDSPVPVPVSGTTGLTPAATALSVSTGGSHSCAVMADGTAKCWGNNGSGQLGNSLTTPSPVPVPVPVSGITGLTAATRVAQSAWSRTLAIAPGMPTDVGASGATSSSLQLSWTAPTSDGGAAISDYVVQYRLASANSWTTFNHVASDSTSITVTGLTPGASYVFQVAAVNLVDTGMFSSPSSAAYTLPTPGAPTNVIASGATGSSVLVSWSAPSSDGGSPIHNYLVQFSEFSNWPLSWTTFSHLDSAATSITVTGLEDGMRLVFRVAAVNSAGSLSAFSDPSVAVQTLSPPDFPRNVRRLGATGSSVQLSWAAPADDGGAAITDYRVRYRLPEGGYSIFTHDPSPSTSITVTGLEQATNYIFCVSAVNSVRHGPCEEVWAATAYPPSAPTDVLGSGDTGSSVQLSWAAPADDGGAAITDYRVRYRLASEDQWSIFTHDPSPSTSITVTGLTSGALYVFQVAAVNSVDTGVYSSPSSATSTLATTIAPTRVIASSATGSSLQVSWTAPVSDGGSPITDYRVQYRKSGEMSWTTFSHDPSPATSITVRSLTSASVYEFRTAAVNGVGPSEWSAPSEVAATSGTRTQRLTVLDSDGAAITGGVVSWATLDGDFRSAAEYGFTALGNVDLFRLPAGTVRVTVEAATLSSGAMVSGSWDIVSSGNTALTLRVPTENSRVERVVRVTSGGTLPILGASVTVSGLTKSITRNGFTFFIPGVKSSGLTDADGSFEARGFSANGDPVATVIYSDGILWQRQRNIVLSAAVTEVALADMPWLQVPDTLTATMDQLVSVPVNVKDRVPAMAALALGLPRATGVSVTITPPAGATQKCKGSKLSGAAVNGKVTLKVCATKSGTYSIAGKGAVATTALTLLVTGSAPLPVTSLNAISPSVGKIAVAWNAPIFNGGKAFPVNGYRIELSSGGKVVKTVTLTKPADISKRSCIFANLTSAKTYSVSVWASNKVGQSDSLTTAVGVA